VPIKWSAAKVSEAMDEVEGQVTLAEPFLDEAKAKAEAAKKIDGLPQYIDQRLDTLIATIERMDYVKGAIKSVRKDIPDGAIEAEQERTKNGSQQGLI